MGVFCVLMPSIVDLAAVGPVWVTIPVGRPDATGITRHVGYISDINPVGPYILRDDSDGLSNTSYIFQSYYQRLGTPCRLRCLLKT